MNELNLWKVVGNCPTHGDYIYNAKKDEKSIGCPVCLSKEFNYIVEYFLDDDFMSNSVGCHTLPQAKEIGNIICDRALKSTDNVKVWIKLNDEVCHVVYQNYR